MKKIYFLITALVLLFGMSPISSKAETSHLKHLTEQDEKELTKNLTKLKINEKKQKELIEKLNKGELWDSLNPKKTEKVLDKITPTLEEPIKRYEFEDGSVIESKMEVINIEESDQPIEEQKVDSEKITAQGVSVISSTSGTGYRNITAKVSYNTGTVFSSFYSKFTLVQGGNDYISSVYDPKITTVGYSFSIDSCGVEKKYETLDGKARGALRFTFTMYNGGYATNYTLKLSVGADTYSSSFY